MAIEWVFKSIDNVTPGLNKLRDSFKKTYNQSKQMTDGFDKLQNSLGFLKDRLKGVKEDRLFSKSREELKKFNVLIKKTEKDISKLEKLPPDGFFKRLKQASMQLTGLKFKDFGIVLAARQLRQFGIESARLYDTQAKADAQLKASLASSGGIAGRSFEQLQKQATQLQRKTLFGDETTMGVQSALLTFKNIRGEVYDKTIPAILDMATALKQEPFEAAKQLGKALNDPIKGLAMLRRQGVQLGEKQQQQIRDMVAAGRVQEAQLIILAELQRKFGGSSEAAAKAGLGPLQQLKMQWNDLQEVIGSYVVAAFNRLHPVLSKTIDFLQNNFKSIITLAKSLAIGASAFAAFKIAQMAVLNISKIFITYMQLKKVALALFANGLKGATVTMKSFNAATKANVFGLVVAGVMAAVAAFKMFSKNANSNKKIMQDATSAAGDYYAKEKRHLDNIFNALKKTNPLSRERNRYVNELKKLLPGMNSELERELRTTNNLNVAQAKAIELLKKQAIAAGMRSVLNELGENIGRAEIKAAQYNRQNEKYIFAKRKVHFLTHTRTKRRIAMSSFFICI